MKKTGLIAWNTIRELLAKKTIYLLLFLILLVTAGNAMEFYSIFQESTTDPQALLARKANVLANMLSTWSTFTILGAIIFSAALIRNEKKNKTVLGIMAKPVARWQFLLGKWGGVMAFFFVFLLIGIIGVVAFMLIWQISFTAVFWTGIFNYIVSLALFSILSFILGVFINPILGGGIAFFLWQFVGLFENMIESTYSIIQGLGYILYFLSPAQTGQELINRGVLNNMLNPEFGLYWSVIAENFLYGAILFAIGALLFQKKDIIPG